MLRLSAALAAFLLIGPSLAQTIVDDTGEALPDGDAQSIVTIMGYELTEAASAEIRGIYRSSGTHAYCGEVRTKDASGQMTEFVPFYANLQGNTAYILSSDVDPERYKELEAHIGIFGCLGQ